MLGSATRPMATDARPDRRVLGAVVLVLLAFWVLLTIAAMEQPGYDVARDSISSLASRGAHDAWIGIVALSVAGVGTIAMGTWLGRLSPPGGLTLGLAGVALLILVVAPLSCVEGAAACSTQSEPRVWSAMWHLVAVNLYEIMFVAAISVAAVQLLHRGARAPGACHGRGRPPLHLPVRGRPLSDGHAAAALDWPCTRWCSSPYR